MTLHRSIQAGSNLRANTIKHCQGFHIAIPTLACHLFEAPIDKISCSSQQKADSIFSPKMKRHGQEPVWDTYP